MRRIIILAIIAIVAVSCAMLLLRQCPVGSYWQGMLGKCIPNDIFIEVTCSENGYYDPVTDKCIALDNPVSEALALRNISVELHLSLDQTNLTLPLEFAGANWGLKQITCKDGGYDLAPYAGKEIIITSFSTNSVYAYKSICGNATCDREEPLRIFQYISNRTVICAFFTMEKGSSMTPGIFPFSSSLVRPARLNNSSCPAGSYWHNALGECILNNTEVEFSCSANTVWDESLQKCVADRPCLHIKTERELSPLMAYCDNDFCKVKEAKAECESVDVVTVDRNGRLLEQFSPDGKPDCYWDDSLPANSACQVSN